MDTRDVASGKGQWRTAMASSGMTTESSELWGMKVCIISSGEKPSPDEVLAEFKRNMEVEERKYIYQH